MKKGDSGGLLEFVKECEALSGNESFYVFIRKESTNTYLITPVECLRVRITPYLFFTNYLLVEFENFIHALFKGDEL